MRRGQNRIRAPNNARNERRGFSQSFGQKAKRPPGLSTAAARPP
jgi:hypothetical protein